LDVVDEADAAVVITMNDLETTRRGALRDDWAGRLSPAEARVMRLLLKGCSEKEIAHHFGLSPRTVHNHITEIYRVLDVQSRSELIAHCLSNHRR